MRFMIIIKANQESESGKLPSAELLAAMGNYNEELVKAGVMRAGEGLHPTSRGVKVRLSGSERTVEKGPFVEPGTICGFWIFEVKSLEEAIAWVKRVPNPTGDESEIEIRQIHTAEDFAACDPTGELRAKEADLRARVSG
jgi:hypothetical protein